MATNYQNKCPHCGSRLSIRSSKIQNPLLKTIYGQCQNLECGWTGQGNIEWVSQISPSAQPNPNISIPFTTFSAKNMVHA